MNKEYHRFELDYILRSKKNLLAKNGKIQIPKNCNENIVNCEESRFKHLFHTEKDFFDKHIYQLETDTLTFERIQYKYYNSSYTLKKEQELLFRNSSASFCSKKLSYESSSFINHLVNLDGEEFDKLLGIGRTRSHARRLMKNYKIVDINTKYYSNKYRVNAILRYFVKQYASSKQLKELVQLNQIENIYTKFKGKNFLTCNNLHYYSNNKIYEEIGKNFITKENAIKLEENCSNDSSSEEQIIKKKKRKQK